MGEWNEPEQVTEEVKKKEQDDRSWSLLEKAVLASTQEARRARRWGIFFKLLTFGYLLVILFLVRGGLQDSAMPVKSSKDHTAVVQVRGVIADQQEASADILISGLRAAFDDKHTKAVVLRINSPGGSPVQAGYVYNEILRLRELNSDIPVYAVIVDTGASGAYYIAAAADEIYANQASIVGSIGVTAAGFGFVDAMEKLGIERRQFTSGDHKAFLDSFAPLRKDEEAFFNQLLGTIHQQFIDDVKHGRGDRLANDPSLFSGLFWTGEQAVELGLVDGLKSTSELARDIGYPELVDFTPARSPYEELLKNLGLNIGKGIGSMLGLNGWSLQ